MGQYNSAVLTTAGQSLLTSILGAEGTLTFSKFQTSSYQYASGTDLSALTSLQNVEQEVLPSAGGVKDATTFYSSSTVSNEGVTVEYDCYTVGLFATDGEDEVLFAVATAITPDVIPVDDGGAPSTYTYTMSISVSSTENITVEVDDQGILRVTSIVDNLTSESTTQPLSAKQGKVLKDLIDQGGGGHVIVAPNGTEMTQRANLKFTGSNVSVTDDAENDTTVVDLGATTASIVISSGGQVVNSVSLDNAVGNSINLDALFNTNAPTYSLVVGDNTIATASLNAAKTVLTINGLKYGNTTVVISTPATSEYTAASVTINVISRVFIPVVGQSYTLGSGAHTGGSADAKATVLAVDTENMKALMQSEGLYDAIWPGQNELDLSSYMGNLNTAIDDAYLPRAQGGMTGPDTNAPTGVSVYTNNAWSDEYSTAVKNILTTAASNYDSLGTGTINRAWLGTYYDATQVWGVTAGGAWGGGVFASNSLVIAPTFILDLTKVKLHGNLIVDINAGDMPKIVTWANGTPSELEAMVTADANGIIDLADWWSDGDERTATIDAVAPLNANYVGQPSQSITLVLSKDRQYALPSRIASGRINSKFILVTKRRLKNKDAVDGLGSYNYMTNGFCQAGIQTWLDGAYKTEMVNKFGNIFKQFVMPYLVAGDTSATRSANVYFTQPSAKNIKASDVTQTYGSNTWYAYYEPQKQIPYFNSDANIVALYDDDSADKYPLITSSPGCTTSHDCWNGLSNNTPYFGGMYGGSSAISASNYLRYFAPIAVI